MSDEDVRIGLELHQQLDTATKLFCHCPTTRRDAEDAVGQIHRTLHPTASEMGTVDEAALAEAATGTEVTYLRYDSTCLVEEDDEPPHKLNEQALDIALQIAAALGMTVIDQLRVMRKIIIDGSMPSGFQRTALVAQDGVAETPVGDIPIKDLLLEEESGRRVNDDRKRPTFSLGRLGIPLIEVGTEPVMSSAEEARTVAEHLGMVFRSTGQVKRGVGTVRQDVNVSIPKGSRVEIKGVQDIDMIEPVIHNEIQRQETLVELSETLTERPTTIETPQDITAVIADVEESLIDGVLDENDVVLAVPLRGFDGVLGTMLMEEMTFGADLAAHARQHGVNGILHTDEVQRSSPLYQALEDEFDLAESDAACLIAADPEHAHNAIDAVINRLEQAADGVPRETRRANPDGTTTYLRPLGGAARMYPETDVPPVEPTPHESAPELLAERAVRYETEHGLSHELANAIAYDESMPIYETLVTDDNIEPSLAARTLTQTLTELEREGVPVSWLSTETLRDVLRRARDGDIAADSVETLLELAATSDKELSVLIDENDLQPLTDEELQSIVQRVVAQNEPLVDDRGTDAVGPLMGECMHAVDGRADGAEVRKALLTVIETQTAEE